VVSSELVRCRIMVVDDEDANVHLTARILQTAGYVDIKEITDAREVLAAIRDWTPDLVLLDLHMPHMDGISLLLAMRAELSSSEFLPVLVLTADASRETLIRAMNAGANDYLTKPIDIDEVLLRVRNLLALRLSHEALRNSNGALAMRIQQQMQSEQYQSVNRNDRIKAVQAVIENGPSMVFQPIITLDTNHPVGFEALARFDSSRPPDNWFAEATILGLGAELELSAVNAAFEHFDVFADEEFMAVNVSPALMLDDRFHNLVRKHGRDRVVIEITEHQPVDHYDDLKSICAEFRRNGLRIAIDDAGAGYASLHHILMLEPDIIKLDISLTRDIDRDPVKRALATSLLQFAREINATVCAEGIETATELVTLHTLGVPWGQGFHIGYPASFNSGIRPIFPINAS
jgi:EAL domain-containing protein (putative c-di-GMP-specific phosphodiesterase class I)/CheY-like chemotaxis protein